MSKRTDPGRFLRNLALCCIAITVAVPVLWGLSLAFRDNEEIVKLTGLSLRTFIPGDFTVGNFSRLFSAVDMVRVIALTLFVCLTVTAASLFVNSLAAYAFARMDFPFKRALFGLVLATMILPIEILIVPLYGVVKALGLMNSLFSLILPFAATGFGIFFLRQFLMGIPKELDEAAVIDGCGRWGVFFRVLLPIARTPLVTLGLIVFLQQWDSFLVPVTFISKTENMMLQVAITNLFAHIYFSDTALLFAGMVVGALPVILIFISLQKYYIAGISSSGIKG
jgi:multiple sugar transport system permease protein